MLFALLRVLLRPLRRRLPRAQARTLTFEEQRRQMIDSALQTAALIDSLRSDGKIVLADAYIADLQANWAALRMDRH